MDDNKNQNFNLRIFPKRCFAVLSPFLGFLFESEALDSDRLKDCFTASRVEEEEEEGVFINNEDFVGCKIDLIGTTAATVLVSAKLTGSMIGLTFLMVVLIFLRFSAACFSPASTAATFLLLFSRSIFSAAPPRTFTLGVQASSLAVMKN